MPTQPNYFTSDQFLDKLFKKVDELALFNKKIQSFAFEAFISPLGIAKSIFKGKIYNKADWICASCLNKSEEEIIENSSKIIIADAELLIDKFLNLRGTKC